MHKCIPLVLILKALLNQIHEMVYVGVESIP
jgi:hypothetical protein